MIEREGKRSNEEAASNNDLPHPILYRLVD
jgi:hypothetical protein